MARKIADPEDAAELPVDENAPKGVTFIKNQVNELIKFKDGSTYKFETSRQTITDQDLIDKLRSVAERCNIFEVE